MTLNQSMDEASCPSHQSRVPLTGVDALLASMVVVVVLLVVVLLVVLVVVLV